MNWGKLKDPLCHLCPIGIVLTSLSLTQEVAGLNTIFYQNYSVSSVDSTDFNLEKLSRILLTQCYQLICT